MSHGVAGIPELANQLLRNREAVLGAVRTFAEEASPELLASMITGMPADVHRMQHEVNPGTQPAEADGPGEAASICIDQGLDVGASESKYCRYATGFYLGYRAFTAVELASGAKALVKGVRKAGDLADKIRGATNTLEGLKDAIRNGDRGPRTALTNEISKDTGYQFGDVSGRLQTGGSVGAAVQRLRQIDGDFLEGLTAAERTRLLEYFAKYPRSAQLVDDAGADGFRLLEDLDDANIRRLFGMEDIDGYREFSNWGDWRANLARGTRNADPAEIDLYVENVMKAGKNDNIIDERGLIYELSRSVDKFTGQSGEAASVMKYAENGYVVRAEPGTGRLDLDLNDGSEYVEVKTSASRPDNVWVVDKIEDVNGKVEEANIDATPRNSALELRIRGDSRTNQQIRDTVESGVETHRLGGGNIDVSEVRIVANGEELQPITMHD